MSDGGLIAIDVQERDGGSHAAISGFGLAQFVDISIGDLNGASYQLRRRSVGFRGKSLFNSVGGGLAGDFASLSASNSIKYGEETSLAYRQIAVLVNGPPGIQASIAYGSCNNTRLPTIQAAAPGCRFLPRLVHSPVYCIIYDWPLAKRAIARPRNLYCCWRKLPLQHKYARRLRAVPVIPNHRPKKSARSQRGAFGGKHAS